MFRMMAELITHLFPTPRRGIVGNKGLTAAQHIVINGFH